MEKHMVTRSLARLHRSQLSFRIGLTRKRVASYPLDQLDFIMMDLERPELSSRHAHWCTGDLTGRLLEFLAVSDGIDGRSDSRLADLFDRIMLTRRSSGLFGRYAPLPTAQAPESDIFSGCHRLFNGFIKYYDLTNDWRSLDAAVGLADWYLANKDRWREACRGIDGCIIPYWITEPLAELYRITGNKSYLDFIGFIAEPINTCQYQHSHGFLSTMRGLQLAALYSGDSEFNAKPEMYRREIIDQHYEMPDGCIAETFPRSFRNEGCSIADWLMLNLNSSLLSGKSDGYEKAETILWNALFFNQFITGGFGHRDLSDVGYLQGPLSECWWCCTENCGLAMTEFARHAVTLRGNTLEINQLVPGVFRFPGMNLEVTISTAYPSRAESIIMVRHLSPAMEVKVRIPVSIKSATEKRIHDDDGMKITVSGRVGHYCLDYEDKVLLCYGPTILAPMVYYWNSGDKNIPTNAPAGYIPTFLPTGLPRLETPAAGAEGLLDWPGGAFPDWSYFELGPGSPLAIESSTCMVTAVFDNQQKKELLYCPMCHITSNMSYYDTPIMFKK